MACVAMAGQEAGFIIPDKSTLLPLNDAEASELQCSLQRESFVDRLDDATLLFTAVLDIRRAICSGIDVGLAAERFIVAQIGSLRSAISRHGIVAAGELAALWGNAICCRGSVDSFVAALLIKATCDKKFIRDPALTALKTLIAAPHPTALLFLALVKHAASKSRSAVTLTAELATSVLDRLVPAEAAQLDLESVAHNLGCYNTSKSADARTCARGMSSSLAAARGVRAWRAAVTAVCREQDSRELLDGLDDCDTDVTCTMDDTVDCGVDKENALYDGSCGSGAGTPHGSAPSSVPATPVRFSLPGPGGKYTVNGRKSSAGRKSCGGSIPLREYLREQGLGRSAARQSLPNSACATPAQGSCRSASAAIGDYERGLFTPGSQYPDAGLGHVRARLSLGAALPRSVAKHGHGVTPLLVLQRASSSPAMAMKTIALSQSLASTLNSAMGAVGTVGPCWQAGHTAGVAASLFGTVSADGSSETAHTFDSLDTSIMYSVPGLGSSGRKAPPFVLPVGEEAAALLEDWAVTPSAMAMAQ